MTNDAKQTSNTGAVITPLPLNGGNLDNAEFYIRMAESKSQKDRTRAVAKAIHFLNKELKEIAGE